jgi:transposase
MEAWKKDARREPVITDLDTLVPQDHLLRKIEKVMDYDWLYERLSPYYCHDNGRPGIDPVVLIKMVLIQHLFGIPSLRQTYREIQVNNAYRWFLGYGLLDEIPHFATVSYAFCKRFPPELSEEIFEHILNKALNNRMVDPSMIFIDGTHIKASANKKKFQKQQVTQTAKIYAEQLRQEVNAERIKLGKKPIEEENDNDDDDTPKGGGTQEKTVSTTDPDCGMFVKGEHERQFAYEAHTACDRHGFVLGVEVTAGNVHDSVAWDAVYEEVTEKFENAKFVVMDAGYKTPWIAKKTLDDGKIPILPYTRYKGKKDGYKPWDYEYDPVQDQFVCPQGGILRHTTTNKDGKRTYRSTPKDCKNCPCKAQCGANEKGQKLLTTHIWQEYLDLVEQLRKTERGKEIYAMRKETIERVFADAKEKHAMRYTHHRGLARVTNWVRLKYAALNLKKLAVWSWKAPCPPVLFSILCPQNTATPILTG